jgi:hypothetical protein
MPAGGTTKSVTLATLPAGVATSIFPEPVPEGTANESDVVVTADVGGALWLSLAVVAPATGLKLVPLTNTTVPAPPDAGVKLAIVGAPAAATMKSCALAAVLPATVTATFPVLAPAGTITVSAVMDAATTGAATPLNATRLIAAVALNPVPVIVTVVPAGPPAGEKPASAIGAGLTRWIATMFPTASCMYWTTFEAVSAWPEASAPVTTHDIANHWRSTGSS